MPIPLQWDGQPGPAHVATVETANRLFDFVPQALHRVQGAAGAPVAPHAAILTPLATGGGMAVYKLTALLPQQRTQQLVCKIPHQRRIVYTSATDHQSAEDATRQLLDRLVTLADHLAQHTPGLFPRSGGVWHWHAADGTPQHLLLEEFIPGLSVERLKLQYEQAWLAQQMSPEVYHQARTAIERLAVATFLRLWNALDRRLFTSDPSPWNVLVHQPDTHLTSQSAATIIDLHGLEDDAGLVYVVQRLAAVYGMRQDMLEEVLIPGILDALGEAEGRALLLAELPRLEAEAERVRQNLGVDVQQPLLRLIRSLA